MKRTLHIVSICIALFLFPFCVRAQQEVGSGSSYINQSATASGLLISPTQILQYQLPYPGILPDNPFYVLKAFRDKIIGLLISDPLKKAEFDLLQADKRLNAAIFLFKQNKEGLGISTLSKGENYFQESLVKLKEAQSQQEDIPAVVRKLSQASAMHEQVVQKIEKTSTGKTKQDLKFLEGRIDDFEKQVSLFSLKK